MTADLVQIGATRDGLDPYLDAARRRGLRAVLVETPAYLRWRQRLGRRPFDHEIAVDRPQDPAAVRAALTAAGVRPALVLTGFERYVHTGFALAAELGVAPWPRCGDKFTPLDKYDQRVALEQRAPQIRQPRFTGRPEAGDTLAFPQVVKPVDGGGGLGVLHVTGAAQRAEAVRRIEALSNYGGGAFRGVLAEEFVPGPEASVQGVAHDGQAYLLGVCDKITALEPLGDLPGASGFREAGHVVRHGALAGPELTELAQRAVTAARYQEGPFHIDVIRGPDGPVFVEMGFRLSGGGLAGLITDATGLSWAEAVLGCHLDDTAPALGTPRATGGFAGRVVVFDPRALAAVPAGPGVRVTARTPVDTAGLSGAELTALRSDLDRHSAAVGQVVVLGDRADDVERVLRSAVPPSRTEGDRDVPPASRQG